MTRQITLTGADGSVWDLSGGDLFAGANPALWGLPAVAVTERTVYALAGTTVVNRRHLARDLVIPIIAAPRANVYDLEDLVARFARALDPVTGDVTITVTRGDGTARKLVATYLAGLDALTLSGEYSGDIEAVIALRAADPYWSATEDQTLVIDPPPAVFSSGTSPFDDGVTGFDAPFPFDGFWTGTSIDDPGTGFDDPFPFDGAGGATVVFDVTNDGDVVAWPTLTARGPATWVEATNLTTGEYWRLPTGIPAGAVLQVVSQPGARAFTVNDTNAYASLAPGATLWGLPPGVSLLAVRFAGTTPASSMTVSATPKYLTC